MDEGQGREYKGLSLTANLFLQYHDVTPLYGRNIADTA